jgi:hypothetical protein
MEIAIRDFVTNQPEKTQTHDHVKKSTADNSDVTGAIRNSQGSIPEHASQKR